MMRISFDVSGIPMSKGSTTRMPGGGTIPAGTTASRKRMAQWREDIRHAALDAMDGTAPTRDAVRMFVEFRLPVPMSSMRKWQWGWLPHTKKPDFDKLARMMCDALTGIVWADDSQVCASIINKCYAWDGRTGATVEVSGITEEEAKEWAETARILREALDVSDEWINPVTGHGADCGCISCHMSQVR